MALDDVEAVAGVVGAADDDALRRAGRDPQPLTDERRRNFLTGMARFVECDPDGAWVAVTGPGPGSRVVGMAEAIRRGSFWGLSMLFVDPQWQSAGVGRALLEAASATSAGAHLRMIQSSGDPRAIRRYSGAGLAMHPAADASGPIDRSALPAGLVGRPGDESDLDLVAEVDWSLGRARAQDVGFLLDTGRHMDVVDSGAGRGFIVYEDHHPNLLGATDEATATVLLWRALAASAKGEYSVHAKTAAQDWAVKVALAARLKVSSYGAMFIDGLSHPPGPWLPSGWYF